MQICHAACKLCHHRHAVLQLAENRFVVSSRLLCSHRCGNRWGEKCAEIQIHQFVHFEFTTLVHSALHDVMLLSLNALMYL